MQLAQAFMGEGKQIPQPPLILVVEDNEDNLLLMSYVLDSLGCKLIGQKDSSKTLLVAKEYQPDLILLDILLPGQSGMDLVRELKREPLTTNITAIAVTALASSEDKERILAAGFDDYISKPYMIDQLETMIRGYLWQKMSASPVFELCQE